MSNSCDKDSNFMTKSSADLHNANPFIDSMITPEHTESSLLDKSGSISDGQSLIAENRVGTVTLYGIPIVSIQVNDDKRLCLAQISNTLLRDFSYNEIHNRRVALGITCLQCTPIQLEILRRTGAMPVSSRRCGLITKREAERLVKSFLEEIPPPQLPENFSFRVHHKCGWGCEGLFIPSRYNSSRAKCIKCLQCCAFLSPNKFIFHYHKSPAATYRHPDAANFNSWRRHLLLADKSPSEFLMHAWEDVKALFNGGCRKRFSTSITRSPKHQRPDDEKNIEQTSVSRVNSPDHIFGTREAGDAAHPAFPQPYNSSMHSFGNMLRSLSVPYVPWWNRFYPYRQNAFHAPPSQCITGQNFENRLPENLVFPPKYFENSPMLHGSAPSQFPSKFDLRRLPAPPTSVRETQNPSPPKMDPRNDTDANIGIRVIQDGVPTTSESFSDVDEKLDVAAAAGHNTPNADKMEPDLREAFACDEETNAEGVGEPTNTREISADSPVGPNINVQATEHEEAEKAEDATVCVHPDQQDACSQNGEQDDENTMDRLREMIIVARKVRSIAENERNGLKDMIEKKSRIAAELKREMSRRLRILKDQFRTEIDQEKRLKLFLEDKLKEAHATLSLYKIPGQLNLHPAFGNPHRD